MGDQSAGLDLARLLREPGKARRMWIERADGKPQDKINYSAVAKVLAEHLWDTGEVSDTVTDLPRKLRDRVRRALVGEGMSRNTMQWFMDAFELGPIERGRLREALEDVGGPPTIRGQVGDESLPVANRLRTLSVNEHHYLGPDRCPTRHVTTQVLQGREDGVAEYLYMFDTNTINVQVQQGARAVSAVRQIRRDIYGVDIQLLRPLRRGQTVSLVYESYFSYAEPPEPEFRRAALEGVESIDLRVQFHPAAIPVTVLFAEWDQLSHHDPSKAEPVEIEADLSVHRYLRSVDNSIVGFRWSWD